MKRMVFILLFSIAAAATQAQPPYPAAPPPPGNITHLEYFINTDPGFGNGTPVTVPVPQPDLNSFAFSVPAAALPQGYYRFYLRSRDANGRWSHTHDAFFSNVVAPVYPVAPPAPVNIVRLEYAIDASPPFGGGTPIAVTPGVQIAGLNVSIPTTGLAAAPHVLYIRSQDANGRWSLTNINFFDNSVAPPYPAAPPAATPLQQMEYFIDTDPGFGLGTPVSFTPGTDVTVPFSVNGIASGNHTFYIRSRNNPWSVTNAVPFSVGIVTPVTWLYIKGEITNGRSHIAWATASEQNSKEFVVEHSTDGSRFTPVATVAAAGNSSTQRFYTADHAAPARGVNYYRIKQVDLDGSFRYSAVLPLLNTAAGGLLLSPNPAAAYTVLLLNQPAERTVLRLYNSGGQLVMKQTINSGMRQHTISTGGLPAGRYMLEVNENGLRRSLVLLKQ